MNRGIGACGIKHHPELLDGSGNYVTFQKGLAVLTDRLTEILKPHIQTSKKVFEIKEGTEGTYIIDINRKEQVRVGAICIATPVTEYSKLIKNETVMLKNRNFRVPGQKPELQRFDHQPAAVEFHAATALRHPEPAFGR